MSEHPPTVVVLGGINGAGKTTSSRRLLADRLQLLTFVNADDIARGLNAFAPEAAAFEAGRVMLQRLEELTKSRSSFAFESTLAGKAYVKFLKNLRAEGYRVELYYFWLASVEMAIRRVADRVKRGGHHIPEETIRLRYFRSIGNFWSMYRPLAHSWYVFDNSLSFPILTAAGEESREPSILDTDSYPRFQEQIANATQRPD